MKKVRLIAQARFLHNGQRVYRGILFTATEREAEELCALRFATLAPDQGDEGDEAQAREGKAPRNRYLRRDMRAVR